MTATVPLTSVQHADQPQSLPQRTCAACRRRGSVVGFVRLSKSGTNVIATRVGAWSGRWTVWPPAASPDDQASALATPNHCEHNTAPRLSASTAPTGGRSHTDGTPAGGVRGTNVCARARCLHMWLTAAGGRSRARSTASTLAARNGKPAVASVDRPGTDGCGLAVALANHIEGMWARRAVGLQRRGIEPARDARSQAWLNLRDELRAAAQPAHRRPGDKRGRATNEHGARE